MPVKTKLLVYRGDALLWSVAAPVADCPDFVTGQERPVAAGTVKADVLDNRMDFKADKPESGEHGRGRSGPFSGYGGAITT